MERQSSLGPAQGRTQAHSGNDTMHQYVMLEAGACYVLCLSDRHRDVALLNSILTGDVVGTIIWIISLKPGKGLARGSNRG